MYTARHVFLDEIAFKFLDYSESEWLIWCILGAQPTTKSRPCFLHRTAFSLPLAVWISINGAGPSSPYGFEDGDENQHMGRIR
jgi:hypothetical protein